MYKAILATCLALLLLLTGSRPTPTVAQGEDACFDKGGHWQAEEETCLLKAALEIEIDYPLEVRDNPALESAVDEFINGHRAEFLINFGEYGMEFWSPGPWTLNISHELYRYQDTLLTYNFIIYEYAGGAHGITYFHTITFDQSTDQVLSLEDILSDDPQALDSLAQNVQQRLVDQLGDSTDPEWIQDGAGPELDNYRNFALSDEALLIFFPPYQVAAYAVGPQTVEVPLAEAQTFLALD